MHDDVMYTLDQGSQHAVASLHVASPTLAVRRLTPRECERLQGVRDDYTKPHHKTKDGPRYRALGNTMAVPVVRWIGERIQMVEDMNKG